MNRVYRIGAYFCLLAATILVLDGCGTSYEVTPLSGGGDYSYSDLNSEFLGKEAVVELKDGRAIDATQIRVEADSLSWTEPLNGNHFSIAASDVKRIGRRNHLLGALEGLGFGVLADVAAIIAISSASSHEFPIGWVLHTDGGSTSICRARRGHGTPVRVQLPGGFNECKTGVRSTLLRVYWGGYYDGQLFHTQ